MPEPESDPSATVLPWPVPGDGDAAAVGAAAEAHPAVRLEFDGDEDEFDGADGAGAVEPVPEDPVEAAGAAEDEPAGAADEAPEAPAPALVDGSDPALADWSELPVAAVEAPVVELEDAPLGLAADPCVAVAVADALVAAAEPADDAETRLVPVETDAPTAFCSVAEELTPAAFAYGAATTIAAIAATTARQRMPYRHAFSAAINPPLANPFAPFDFAPAPTAPCR